jgi:hypothetical protein
LVEKAHSVRCWNSEKCRAARSSAQGQTQAQQPEVM